MPKLCSPEHNTPSLPRRDAFPCILFLALVVARPFPPPLALLLNLYPYPIIHRLLLLVPRPEGVWAVAELIRLGDEEIKLVEVRGEREREREREGDEGDTQRDRETQRKPSDRETERRQREKE